jgi:hypothetical protein
MKTVIKAIAELEQVSKSEAKNYVQLIELCGVVPAGDWTAATLDEIKYAVGLVRDGLV